jgi:hypothetical protein
VITRSSLPRCVNVVASLAIVAAALAGCADDNTLQTPVTEVGGPTTSQLTVTLIVPTSAIELPADAPTEIAIYDYSEFGITSAAIHSTADGTLIGKDNEYVEPLINDAIGRVVASRPLAEHPDFDANVVAQVPPQQAAALLAAQLWVLLAPDGSVDSWLQSPSDAVDETINPTFWRPLAILDGERLLAVEYSNDASVPDGSFTIKAVEAFGSAGDAPLLDLGPTPGQEWEFLGVRADGTLAFATAAFDSSTGSGGPFQGVIVDPVSGSAIVDFAMRDGTSRARSGNMDASGTWLAVMFDDGAIEMYSDGGTGDRYLVTPIPTQDGIIEW